MWQARTKDDLIIEVWEKLDCESVGAPEIEAIETVVREQYSDSAVDSPMIIARLLADEGADLRHSEIMTLYVERASDRPYDAVFRNILNIDSLTSAEATIRRLEGLRQKYRDENDKQALGLVFESARRAKESAAEIASRDAVDAAFRQINAEIVQWFIIWLQTPEVFDDWLALRKRSPEFIKSFETVGFKDIPLDEIVGIKAVGVTPEYIKEMRSKGFDYNKLHKYVTLKSID